MTTSTARCEITSLFKSTAFIQATTCWCTNWVVTRVSRSAPLEWNTTRTTRYSYTSRTITWITNELAITSTTRTGHHITVKENGTTPRTLRTHKSARTVTITTGNFFCGWFWIVIGTTWTATVARHHAQCGYHNCQEKIFVFHNNLAQICRCIPRLKCSPVPRWAIITEAWHRIPLLLLEVVRNTLVM